MMLSLLFVVALSSPSAGVTGTVDAQFTVSVPVDRLAEWVASHANTIAERAGSRVEWRNGNEFHVVRSTPRGPVEATLKDDIRRIPGGYQYACRLVPGSSDELEAYALDCTLVALDARRSRLTIKVQSTVSMRVRDWQLERSMRQSLEKVRALFEGLK
jgi:hypothetical protein